MRLAVTYGLPIPELDDSATVVDYPVLLEYLPYRKDDSMYPLRYNYKLAILPQEG